MERYAADYGKVLYVRPGMARLGVIAICDEEALLSRYRNPEETYAREILLKKMRFYYRLVGNMSFALDYGSSSKPLGHPAKPAQLLILWSIPC